MGLLMYKVNSLTYLCGGKAKKKASQKTSLWQRRGYGTSGKSNFNQSVHLDELAVTES